MIPPIPPTKVSPSTLSERQKALLVRGVSLVSFLGLLGSNVVWAQTSDSTPQPISAESAPSQPDSASSTLAEPTVIAPAENMAAPDRAVTPPVTPGDPAPSPVSIEPEPVLNERYVDPTSYGIGATQRSNDLANSQPQAPQPGSIALPSAPAAVQVGPLTVSSYGLSVASPTPPSVNHYYYRSLRPPGRLGNNLRLLFPLSIPAPITSVFGWRIHPVTGGQRFHSGTDIGAPIGTPVLAAYAGQVAIADFLGGYGLAVTLSHNKGTEQTLYAHLSEIFVKPGEWVKQGMVIGRVGSTGLSTGPHLHFEFRQFTPEGWVALDAGAQLEYALAQLMQGFQVAQADTGSLIGRVNGGAAGTAKLPAVNQRVSDAKQQPALPEIEG